MLLNLFILIMLANILKLGGASAIAAAYYYVTQNNRIALTNPYLSRLFKLLRQQKPQYAQPLFKMLLSLQLLEHNPSLSRFILETGFDPQGKYIQQVKNLGFHGIEVGPASFNPSLKEDTEQHLGIMNAIANICTYRDKFKDHPFLVQLNIAPNLQILKYTPYLMKENLIGSLNHLILMQQKCPYNIVDGINFSFQRAGYSLPQAELGQVDKMVGEIKRSAEQVVKSLRQHPPIRFTRNTAKYMDWPSLLDCIIRGSMP